MEEAKNEKSSRDIVRQSVPDTLLKDLVVDFFGREAILGAVENAATGCDSVTVSNELEIPDNIILGEN